MSAAVTPEFVYKVMQSRERNLFKVKDGNNTLLEQDDSTVSVDMAITELEDLLNNLSGNMVVIELRDPKNTGQGGSRGSTLIYKVKLSQQSAPMAGMHGMGGYGNNYPQQGLNWADMYIQKAEELAEAKRNLQAQELNYQLKELKTELAGEKGGMRNSAIELIAGKVFEMMATGQPVARAGIAGTDDNTPGQMTNEKTNEAGKEQTRRVMAAIKLFRSIDENWLEHLELLANYAAQNPVMYKSVLNTIKGQQ